MKIGVKPDAKYVGGFNLFGEKFGDYPQSIIMQLYNEAADGASK
jgi:predicted transcriptional regulator